jgi:hypothetical protein
MQLTLVHTPKDITPSLKSVCRLLSENEPMFVNVVPPSGLYSINVLSTQNDMLKSMEVRSFLVGL